MTAVPAAAAPHKPPAAVRAACIGDAKRLCGAKFGNRQAVQACMQAHQSDWSEGCKAAVAAQRQSVRAKHQAAGAGAGQTKHGGCAITFNGKCRTTQWLRRRERCSTSVADAYRSSESTADHNTRAPKALRQCMHGETPMGL